MGKAKGYQVTVNGRLRCLDCGDIWQPTRTDDDDFKMCDEWREQHNIDCVPGNSNAPTAPQGLAAIGYSIELRDLMALASYHTYRNWEDAYECADTGLRIREKTKNVKQPRP